MSFQELLQALRREDEVVLLELLDVTSEELVDKFLDEIAENEGHIRRYYNDN